MNRRRQNVLPCKTIQKQEDSDCQDFQILLPRCFVSRPCEDLKVVRKENKRERLKENVCTMLSFSKECKIGQGDARKFPRGVSACIFVKTHKNSACKEGRQLRIQPRITLSFAKQCKLKQGDAEDFPTFAQEVCQHLKRRRGFLREIFAEESYRHLERLLITIIKK